MIATFSPITVPSTLFVIVKVLSLIVPSMNSSLFSISISLTEQPNTNAIS